MTPRKNILLITLDDAVAFWKFRSIFGVTLQTPNLDRICAESALFSNAYCQAPICSPSRASMMSAKAPHQTGITGAFGDAAAVLDPGMLWIKTLKDNGFFCSSGGKVLKSYKPLPKPLHRALYSDVRRFFAMDRRKRWYKANDAADDVPKIAYGGYRGGLAAADARDDATFYDHQVAESAMAFFDRYDRDTPFYREVGFHDPHGPWITPRRFKDMYDETQFVKPAEWQDGFAPCPVMDEDGPINFPETDLGYWQKSVRNYFSALTHADYQLGRVWDALKASRHEANTVVIIASDHGMHLGDRSRFRKQTLWEQVANVPLILHDPDQLRGVVIDDPVALLDVGPTIMDIAGLPPIADSPGQSLLPMLQGARAPDRAVPTAFLDNVAIRKGKYRFIRYRDGSTQLFDLDADWWQTRDLGPDHPDFADLRAAHAACCQQHGFDPDSAPPAA